MRADSPPRAITGKRAAPANAANRTTPIGRPADGLALSKTGETTAASAPARAARSTAAAEWAAQVTIQRGRPRKIAAARCASRSGR